MKILIIINDAPYGSERAFNALRIANQINKDFPEIEVCIFLMGDGVNCAIPNQHLPHGHYEIEKMLQHSINHGSRLLLCTSCVEARGLKEMKLIDNTQLSSMAELTKEISISDKVINY